MQKQLIFLLSFILIFSFVHAQNGKIEGTVRDKTTNLPVEFASVLIENTGLGTTTDEKGNFSFNDALPGFKHVIVSFVGYETTRSSEFQVQGNQTTFVEILLPQSSISLNEVVVSQKVNIKRIESPVSLLKVEVQQIEKSAGINRDISKLVQTLPGVASTAANRNDLIVRGGGPAENVFYLDEIEIPVINHFSTQGASGGVVGIVNPDFVRDMDFYTGAYPANRANALSSVMDIKQKDGSRDRVHTKLSVGASDAALTLDGPINDKSSFIVSARQSYLQLLFKGLKLPFLPNYNDFQAKYKIRFNDKNELSLIGIGAIDNMRLNTDLKNPDESQRYILAYLPVYKQWNYAIGAVYKHYSDSFFDTWVLSRNMLRNQNYKYFDNDESQPRVSDYASDETENKLRFERNFTRLPFKMLAGAGMNYARYTNETSRRVVVNDALEMLKYNTTLKNINYQFFTQLSDTYFDNALSASFGVYLEGNNFTDYMANPLHQISPRASLAYQFHDAWSLNANVGRYLKRPAYITMGFKDNNDQFVNQREDMRYTFSDQLVIGLGYDTSSKLNVTLEGFYKKYGNYPVSVSNGISLASIGTEYGQVGDEAVRTIGKGKAYGAELYARYNPGERFRASLTYTLFWSEFTDARGNYIPSSWDTRHLLNILASYTFGKNWNVAARWRFIGGAPYTPINELLSSQKAVWDASQRPVLDYGRYNSLRLANAHQLDVRIDKEFYFSKWAFNVYIDVQNAYNFQSENAPNYTNLDAEGNVLMDENDASRYTLRAFKSFSGTVLPTVGVIVKF